MGLKRSVAQFTDMIGTKGGQFAKSVGIGQLAMNDDRMFSIQAAQYLSNGLRQFATGHTYELAARPGRVGQRAQKIEDRAKPKRLADGHGVLHGFMV